MNARRAGRGRGLRAAIRKGLLRASGAPAARHDFETACRASARSTPLGDGVLLVTPLGALREGGLRLLVESDDRTLAPHLALDGFWESWVSIWLRDELLRTRRRGRLERMLNVGANCGYFTLLAAELGAEVVAVEPNARLARHLIDSARLSGLTSRVRVVEGACSDHTGEVELVWISSYSGDGFIDRSPAFSAQVDAMRQELGATFERTSVSAHRADDLCPEATLLFVDAEGHEPFVWEGARRTRSRPGFRAVLEWSPGRYDDAPGLHDAIRAEGFRFLRIREDGREEPLDRDAALGREHMVVLRREGASRAPPRRP
ncbi:MAG TPA: FkbM family methyltransferase [Myxococcota bacterium]|nr:FkbM family methyltransferase [Myxococcota bacterium]